MAHYHYYVYTPFSFLALFLMKKNSLELKKKQHAMLIEQERKDRERRERRVAAVRNESVIPEKVVEDIQMGKSKFKRGAKLPRREYKAERRRARLAKYAPRITSSDSGDIDMMMSADSLKRVIPVSKTLRLVKDKATSIRK